MLIVLTRCSKRPCLHPFLASDTGFGNVGDAVDLGFPFIPADAERHYECMLLSTFSAHNRLPARASTGRLSASTKTTYLQTVVHPSGATPRTCRTHLLPRGTLATGAFGRSEAIIPHCRRGASERRAVLHVLRMRPRRAPCSTLNCRLRIVLTAYYHHASAQVWIFTGGVAADHRVIGARYASACASCAARDAI